MNRTELEACMEEVMAECKALKIPISGKIDPQIYINRRAKSRFAACKREAGKECYKIEVCESLLGTDRMTVKSILAHELLHTCCGCYNHGDRWKFYADMMNRNYGYDIKTVTTYEALGLKAPDKKKTIRYMVVCQRCGKKIYRQKKSRLITNTSDYRCSCGGRLKAYKAE
ncbi:sprT domain-containing protein [Anaerovorax odorimutans]|uniref:SprT domain-containing protein n=1 Tax=Anaerovorax odorimutans TaxID=109327 RepID=A0ABT1RQJ5_9FIRM|nr:SprT-like domain-containing protein [Anaerovorax odorimutans]MCQ4637450.1 sprT domain-containing protein [Anaerovorax odorimutans]